MHLCIKFAQIIYQNCKMCAYVYACGYIYVCMHICVHLHAYIYVCVCTDRDRWTEMERHTFLFGFIPGLLEGVKRLVLTLGEP